MFWRDLVIFSSINLVVVFILSHVSVDEQFPKDQKSGAYAVIGTVALIYLVFGIFFS